MTTMTKRARGALRIPKHTVGITPGVGGSLGARGVYRATFRSGGLTQAAVRLHFHVAGQLQDA